MAEETENNKNPSEDWTDLWEESMERDKRIRTSHKHPDQALRSKLIEALESVEKIDEMPSNHLDAYFLKIGVLFSIIVELGERYCKSVLVIADEILQEELEKAATNPNYQVAGGIDGLSHHSLTPRLTMVDETEHIQATLSIEQFPDFKKQVEQIIHQAQQKKQ